MTQNTTAAPAALSEPTRLVSASWIALFATAWFGIWMAQLTPVQLLLPQQVEAQISSDYWVDKVVAFGIISGIAGACALVAYPLTGALSDRTTSRFGRRRPWILAGALLFALSLVVLGLQTTMVGIGVL
jgi:MFS family permease